MSESDAVKPPEPPHECEKAAADLGFDLTRQFLTIAISGIAFVVGVSFSSPGVVKSSMLWVTIGLFAASAGFGLLFLMHGVNRLSEHRSFDIYATSLRLFSILQILFVVAGIVLLCPIVANRNGSPSTSDVRMIEIRRGDAQVVRYPVGAAQNVEVVIDAEKIHITGSTSSGSRSPSP